LCWGSTVVVVALVLVQWHHVIVLVLVQWHHARIIAAAAPLLCSELPLRAAASNRSMKISASMAVLHGCSGGLAAALRSRFTSSPAAGDPWVADPGLTKERQPPGRVGSVASCKQPPRRPLCPP